MLMGRDTAVIEIPPKGSAGITDVESHRIADISVYSAAGALLGKNRRHGRPEEFRLGHADIEDKV